MRRIATALALLPGFAHPGDTQEQAVEKALAAFAAKDETALAALAATDDPDPWRVADDLLARGAADAAAAFARAAPRKDTEGLPAYAAAFAGDADVRRAVDVAERALAAGDAVEALAALEDEAHGAGVTAVRASFARGLALRRLNRLEESAVAFEAAAEAAERLGWVARAGPLWHESGASCFDRSDFRGALRCWERRVAIDGTRGDRRGVARALGNIGNVHRRLGDNAKALEFHERSLREKEEIGDRVGAASTLDNMGTVYGELGDFPRAFDLRQRALRLQEELGDRAGAATTLGHIAILHYTCGDYEKALGFALRALEANEDLGRRIWAARNRHTIGNIQSALGDHGKALGYLEHALEVYTEAGERSAAATTRACIGNVRRRLGDYARALEHQTLALAEMEAIGEPAGVAWVLGNLGILACSRGDYANALSFLDRSLARMRQVGDRAGIARTLGNVAAVHQCLGDSARALELQLRALEMSQEAGLRAEASGTLGNIGSLYLALGDHGKAIEYQERARAEQEALGDRAGVARTLGNIAAIRDKRGELAGALSLQEQALARKEQLRDRGEVAFTLANIGTLHHRLGDEEKALAFGERALAEAESVGALGTQADALTLLAVVRHRQGRDREAVAAARDALRRGVALVQSLPDDLGGSARGGQADACAIGVLAAIALGDMAEALFFLESGRAGALLEGLRAGEALRAAALSPDLLEADDAARASEAIAADLLRRAVQDGALETIRARRAELAAARELRAGVVGRIQREAKAAAGLLYPEPAPLERIRRSLRDGDALVVYALAGKEAVALVVTPDAARAVPLGRSAEIEAACVAAGGPDADAGRLRERLAAPLALDDRVRRVLVSPDGILAYVPFGMLFVGLDVACVPSGTSLVALTEGRSPRGECTLALGDPDYGTRRDPGGLLVVRGGSGLARLPATADEAKAVGDVVLLGAAATEAGLREALARRPRWRAVHLACHGLVDPERPALSALAITPTREDDGFLTTLDIFRMTVPADLVVLSACETGKGKVMRGEGIMGLARAFMFAGAPRVLCSLWDVDDESTRALMEKFHDRWKAGAPAAAALREAQAFVRSQEKWRHPRYWAAWVLWGLPE